VAASTSAGVVLGFDALILAMVCATARYILWAAIVALSAALMTLVIGVALLKFFAGHTSYSRECNDVWYLVGSVCMTLTPIFFIIGCATSVWGLFYVAFFCSVPLPPM